MRESSVKIHKGERGRAPEHLTEGSRMLWERLATDYSLLGDDHALLLLTSGLEARDRMIQAREILDREGLVTTGDRGGSRAHPATVIERDSHARMLQSFKALRLDIEPVVLTRPGRKGK